MARAEARTTKRINPAHLSSLLGGVAVFTSGSAPDSTEEKLVQAETDQATLDSALASYSYDAHFGKPAEDRDMATIRTKAQAVWDGTQSFTTPEIQKLLAGIVLRLTR